MFGGSGRSGGYCLPVSRAGAVVMVGRWRVEELCLGSGTFADSRELEGCVTFASAVGTLSGVVAWAGLRGEVVFVPVAGPAKLLGMPGEYWSIRFIKLSTGRLWKINEKGGAVITCLLTSAPTRLWG